LTNRAENVIIKYTKFDIWGVKTTEKCSVSNENSLMDEENDYDEIIF
jgi:hypothetical protein